MTKAQDTVAQSAASGTAADEQRKRLFDQVEGINRSWLERMRELRTVEADFGSKLIATTSPTEAMTVCHQWMAKRLEVIGAEQQALAKSWVEVVGILGDSAKAAFQKPKKD